MEIMEKNSKEMDTNVEIFVIEETAELIYDDDKLSEWNKYVETLGLKGQNEIAQSNKSPIPYMYINENLRNAFKVLCPVSVDVKEYNVTPIPVEILRHISLSVKEKYFQRIEIWYDDKDKDPIAVGVTGYYTPISSQSNWHSEVRCKSPEETLEWLKENNLTPRSGYEDTGGYFSSDKIYLIGRWADVKRSFKELVSIAKERYISEKKLEYEKQIKEYQRKIEDLLIDSEQRFNDSSVNNLPF